jgi:transposase
MGRYDLTDFEWSAIEPLMPMDRRGPKPKNNRQIINGMFYILRTGSPWRDLPERYGPYTSVYNRFNRWRKAGIWDKLMGAIVKAHDGKVQIVVGGEKVGHGSGGVVLLRGARKGSQWLA